MLNVRKAEECYVLEILVVTHIFQQLCQFLWVKSGFKKMSQNGTSFLELFTVLLLYHFSDNIDHKWVLAFLSLLMLYTIQSTKT